MMNRWRSPVLITLSLALAACEHATEATAGSATSLPTSTPAAEGVNDAALTALVTRSTAEHSDAVIIVRNGKVVYENHFGLPDVPIYAASVSKSFVSLAYGYLLADRKLASLDEKVVKYLPLFAVVDPRKANITLRMLLTHTSGLQPGQAGQVGMDVVTFAIQEPLVFAPGTSWQYLNAGADLAGALVALIGGEPIDQLIQRKLFTPLGITTAYWDKDHLGIPYTSGAFGGLRIQAMDLAKVGQTILDGGMWKGTQVIPADYIASAEATSQSFTATYGLFWWRAQNSTARMLTEELFTLWEGNGLSPTITAKLRPLVGRTFTTADDLRSAELALLSSADLNTLNLLIATGDHIVGNRYLYDPRLLGTYFEGYRGQYLFIVPEKQLVTVRMRQYTAADLQSGVETFTNPTFLSDSYNLVPSPTGDIAPVLRPATRY